MTYNGVSTLLIFLHHFQFCYCYMHTIKPPNSLSTWIQNAIPISIKSITNTQPCTHTTYLLACRSKLPFWTLKKRTHNGIRMLSFFFMEIVEQSGSKMTLQNIEYFKFSSILCNLQYEICFWNISCNLNEYGVFSHANWWLQKTSKRKS